YKPNKDGSKSHHEIKCEKAIAELEAVVDPFLETSGVLQMFEVMEAAGGILTKIICHIGDKRYIPAMMEEGLFDFDAIVFLVIRLIKHKGRKWLLERLASEEMALKNLYIDEAQDSDIVQNYLISVLAGGDDKSINVTVVGDVKQSIYQWRNAYPEEFRQMYKEASDSGRSADLKMSWRVNNEENLKLINDMFFRMASNSGSLWDYENSRDELEPNPKKIDKSKTKKLKITRMFTDTDIKSLKAEIEGFIAGGSCGILVDKKVYADKSGILEILDSVKQRVKIDNSGKAEVLGTAMPERMLLTSMLNLRLNEKLQYMPYLLLLTAPGNIIRNNAKDIKKAPDMYELFKTLKYYTESVYDTYRESGIAKSLCSLMDKYGLWKYMSHGTALAPDTLSEASIRRGINSIIAAVHIKEKTPGTEIYSREDAVADTVDADNSPFEWYGLPGSAAKAGDRELTTIHSSKGLQYDNTIIFTDLVERLKPDTDFSDAEYKYLYHADFEGV
ncbi:MAG TPA: UvrD-helicase domain-containing protein, partial [Candidatus Goldiibacteriota bacterium]|nr:UvrD-helicase domain-containing protein [Candidatus Goldiibacteriota bacterium]